MDYAHAYTNVTLLFLRADHNTGSIITNPVPSTAEAIMHGLTPDSAVTALVHMKAWDMDGAALDALYRSLLGRAPDTLGYQAWLAFGNNYDLNHGGQPSGLTFAALNAIGSAMLGFPEARAHGATAADVAAAIDVSGWRRDDGFAYAAANALGVDFRSLPADHTNHVSVVSAILTSEWLA